MQDLSWMCYPKQGLSTHSSQSAHLPWQHHVRAYDALKLKGGRECSTKMEKDRGLNLGMAPSQERLPPGLSHVE